MVVIHIEDDFVATMGAVYIVNTNVKPITCSLQNIHETENGYNCMVLNKGSQYIHYIANCLINYQGEYINSTPYKSNTFFSDGTQYFVL